MTEQAKKQVVKRAAEAITPLDMIRSAQEKGADAETLKQYMDLYDRWQADQAKKAFNEAVTAFKANPPEVIKDMRNKQYTSNDARGSGYTSLANLVNTVNAALAAHELTARWDHGQTESGAISVTCILSHVLGHSESVTLSGPPDDSGKKNALQKIKSTLTYLKGATFEAVTGIASRDANTDDDGNSADVPETITEEQVATLEKLIKDTGSNKEKFLEYIKADSLEAIAAKSFDMCVKLLKSKPKAKK